jgi:peroxin-19
MEKKLGDLEGLAEGFGKAMEKDSASIPTPKDPESAEVPKLRDHVLAEDVPDPDEDDLDDLDGQSSPLCATRVNKL